MTGTADVASAWLEARNISKHYGAIHAAVDIDLNLRRGEVHGLIGPNGAGKSTLVKVLAGVIQPDAGSILLDGTEVRFHTPVAAQGRGIVLMPQEIAVVADRNLIDNVTLGAESTRFGLRSAGACRQRTEDALGAIGMAADPTLLAGALSAAEQRLVMLARAIDRKVRLLILDEPTAGLPPREAALVLATVRRLAARHITVVYVSHHLSEVAELCYSVTCIREGRVAATLTGADVHSESLMRLLVDVQPSPVEALSATQDAPEAARVTAPAGLELTCVRGARIHDVSLIARQGEITGLTGLLGSGLAEVVAIVIGSAQVQAGSMQIRGQEVSVRSPGDALALGVAYASGDRAQVAFTELSVTENVSISALKRWFGRFGLVRRRKERSLASGYLSRFDVKADPELPLSALSGGNQQRALLARLLAADADVLVLEEPTAGVDVAARRAIWATIRSIAAGRTVIVASSESEELVAMCDRVACFRGGTVSTVLEGSRITEHEIARAIA